MTAPKNKKRNGYGKKRCSSNVESSAAATQNKAVPKRQSTAQIGFVGRVLASTVLSRSQLQTQAANSLTRAAVDHSMVRTVRISQLLI
jgi:hypothetical protein